MSDRKYRSIKGVMANLAESLEKERDEVLTENSTLRAIIHGLHKQPSIVELARILQNPDAPAVEITTFGEVAMKGLRHEIENAINRVSGENGSNTPDFILADYLVSCLAAFDRAVQARERWYGFAMHVAMPDTITRPYPPATETCSPLSDGAEPAAKAEEERNE